MNLRGDSLVISTKCISLKLRFSGSKKGTVVALISVEEKTYGLWDYEGG